jgi:RNA-directed DNA polymerase
MFETKLKTVPITQNMVKSAYKKVKKNKGSSGVDNESLADYQLDLQNNLYKLWNKLASGSYYPKPVLEVEIPKSNGKTRLLGIPTVSDRIAQQVIKSYLEPRLEKEFLENSYGYRPLRSAHDALESVRENVRKYAWVIDMDIKSFFDEVDHELILKALDEHVEERWIKFYIQRWLEVPSQSSDGELKQKDGRGTPQGGVISPLLANLFLHYVLDKWLEKQYPGIPFVRYADDIIIHCQEESIAQHILGAVRERLKQCGLRLNEEKTKTVCCKSFRKEKKHYRKKFDFLGFTFKPRTFVTKDKVFFTSCDCAISQSSQKRIQDNWRSQQFHRNSRLTIQTIANRINPQMRGILRYYGKFGLWHVKLLVIRFHNLLAKWVLKKYKRFKGSFHKAYNWIKTVKRSYPTLFYHWTLFKTL